MAPSPWLQTAMVPTCLCYIAYFAAAGVSQPYFPIWLSHRGLDETQIATLLAVAMLFRIASGPFVGWLADRLGKPEHILRMLLAVTLGAAAWCSLPVRSDVMLPAFALMLIAWQGIMPLLEVRALDLVRTNVVTDYGRIRLWGSASFIAMNVMGGFILGREGPTSILIAFMVMNATLFLTSFLPLHQRTESIEEPLIFNICHRQASIRLWGFLGVAALIQASHMSFNAFGSIYLRQHGYADTTIGVLWGIAAISEIVMFWLGPHVARLLSPTGMLATAAVCAAARWMLFFTELDIAFLVLLQLSQALTFSMTYLGLMRLIAGFVGSRRSSYVQGLHLTIQSAFSAVATFAAGAIFNAHGGWVFILSAGLALLALILLAVICKYRSIGETRE